MSISTSMDFIIMLHHLACTNLAHITYDTWILQGVRIPYPTRIGHGYGSDTPWIRIQAVLQVMDTYGYRYAYQTRWGRCGYGP
jgi:hypothetical protein